MAQALPKSQDVDSKQNLLALKKGKGMFLLSQNDFPTLSAGGLKVYYYLPSLSKDLPIVFVLHGVNRNADTYRDNWITHSKKRNFAVIVPEFTIKDFPKSWGYNMGNMWLLNKFVAKKKKVVMLRKPIAQWSFTAIETVFSVLEKRAHFSTKTVFLNFRSFFCFSCKQCSFCCSHCCDCLCVCVSVSFRVSK